jgi:predicted CopG family antitoxin
MGYKTISLSEEAYKRLLERKRGNESFSDVVMRLTTNSTLNDFVGILSPESCSKLENAVVEFRESRVKYFKNGLETLKN